MIEFKQGDVLQADVEALVNTVNCVGIMGRGVALQFRKRFPENYDVYRTACQRGEVRPGRMFVYETGRLTNPRYIINFPTKRHWKGKSRLEDIDAGLVALVQEIKERRIHSIALPPLGSGLGGLEWSAVKRRIVAALRGIEDLQALVFEPGDAPANIAYGPTPRMTAGRAALIGLVQVYLSALLDPFLSLLELHKLMYFMQEAGERLKLRFVQAPYGPYSENLRQVLIATEGYYTTGYGDGGDSPRKSIHLVPGAAEDAGGFLAANRETRARLDRVAKLVHGFETPHGLELLATVHWVVTKQGARNVQEAITLTYAWNERKRRFSSGQIELAWNTLANGGWFSSGSEDGRSS